MAPSCSLASSSIRHLGVRGVRTARLGLASSANREGRVSHYHSERNPQGFGNELLALLPANTSAGGSIRYRERLGGILRFYYRGAA